MVSLTHSAACILDKGLMTRWQDSELLIVMLVSIVRVVDIVSVIEGLGILFSILSWFDIRLSILCLGKGVETHGLSSPI